MESVSAFWKYIGNGSLQSPTVSKESSFVNYCNKFEKHIIPEFGDIPCVDINAVKLNNFINKKLSEGFSASYIKDIITVFKSMLIYAQEEYGFSLSLKKCHTSQNRKEESRKIQ